MRNLKTIILFCGFIGFASITCEKNSDKTCQGSSVTIQSLKDASGIIWFDSSINQYYIYYWIEGTIDEIYTLYPCSLDDEFKKENLHVIFSGDLYVTDDLPKTQIAGHEVFHIKLRNVTMVPIR